MRAFIKKDNSWCSIIETQFKLENTFLFNLIRNNEVIREIWITFKQALVLDGAEIKVIWMAEYTKDNGYKSENPYRCSLPELLNDLALWVSETETSFYGIPYKLTVKESKDIVSSILSNHCPNVDWYSTQGRFIKWLN